MERDWQHLEPLVDALVDAGNEVVEGGFRPTQGGAECGLRDPLNAAIVGSFLGEQEGMAFDAETDEVHCRHCWTTVYGGAAARRYRAEHEAAVRRRDRS